MQMETQSPSKPRAGIRTYLLVFLGLAVITGVEIGLATVGLSRSLRVPIFIVLSLVKASLVAAFYMHLRSDARFFTAIFITPVVLILAVEVLFVIATARIKTTGV